MPSASAALQVECRSTAHARGHSKRGKMSWKRMTTPGAQARRHLGPFDMHLAAGLAKLGAVDDERAPGLQLFEEAGVEAPYLALDHQIRSAEFADRRPRPPGIGVGEGAEGAEVRPLHHVQGQGRSEAASNLKDPPGRRWSRAPIRPPHRRTGSCSSHGGRGREAFPSLGRGRPRTRDGAPPSGPAARPCRASRPGSSRGAEVHAAPPGPLPRHRAF